MHLRSQFNRALVSSAFLKGHRLVHYFSQLLRVSFAESAQNAAWAACRSTSESAAGAAITASRESKILRVGRAGSVFSRRARVTLKSTRVAVDYEQCKSGDHLREHFATQPECTLSVARYSNHQFFKSNVIILMGRVISRNRLAASEMVNNLRGLACLTLLSWMLQSEWPSSICC
jgi:hypothetical protein